MNNDSFDAREAAQLLWRAVDGFGKYVTITSLNLRHYEIKIHGR